MSDQTTKQLQDEADRFGGKNESKVVPTYHIRITAADLAAFNDTKTPILVDNVAFVWREDPPEDPPDADFVAFVSQHTLDRLVEGQVVNYGIRQIDGRNQTLHVSKGGVSDLYGDNRSPTERIREEEPHLREYID